MRIKALLVSLVVLFVFCTSGYAEIISEIHPIKDVSYNQKTKQEGETLHASSNSEVRLNYNLFGTSVDKIEETTLLLDFQRIIKGGDLEIWVDGSLQKTIPGIGGTERRPKPIQMQIPIVYGDDIKLIGTNGLRATLGTPLLRLSFPESEADELSGYEIVHKTVEISMPAEGYDYDISAGITCSTTGKKLLSGGVFIRGKFDRCVAINSSFPVSSSEWKIYFTKTCFDAVTVDLKLYAICAN